MGILMRISAGPCTMSELARFQAVSLPTISKSVDMLVRRIGFEHIDRSADRYKPPTLSPNDAFHLTPVALLVSTCMALLGS